MQSHDPPLRLFGEVLGLSPLRLRLRQARIALRGEEDVPPSTYDRTSLTQLRPRLARPLWRGRYAVHRQIIVTNLFNHRQTPIEAGWSVKRTQTLDFRGRDLTYDSHNGTDFSMPVGSTVVAAAPGKVLRVASEFNRGGLKVFIDHGQGLMTCTAHLARPLVEPGQIVARGQPIALSGYSGLDAVVTLGLNTPHIHFNVWLNGEPIDPFPHDGLPSLWRAGERPVPARDVDPAEAFAPSPFEADTVERGIDACITPAARRRLRAIHDLPQRAGALVAEMNYYPTRFHERVSVYAEPGERRGVLDLPVTAEQFDGMVFADEL